MKLYQKFLLALLSVSLIPLILYSLILLNTTGITLKNVIDKNNINTMDNIVREVNKFFVEVEKRLDVARQIERDSKMKDDAKIRLIYEDLATTRMLLAMYLLDDKMNVKGGMSAEYAPSEIIIDKKLMKKVLETNQVEISMIQFTEDGKPYMDIVYPISIGPDKYEYMYFRGRIEYLIKRINYFFYGNQEKNTAESTKFLSAPDKKDEEVIAPQRPTILSEPLQESVNVENSPITSIPSNLNRDQESKPRPTWLH